MQPTSGSLSPRRLLVRGVNWLGDAVMTTPALLRLRERFPRAHIALLTPEKLSDLWREHPAANATLTLQTGEGVLSVSRKVGGGKFDLALVLPNSPRSALEVWLARIPQRVGAARPWRNWLLTQAVPPRAGAVDMRQRSVGEIRRLATPPASSIANRQSPIANPAVHHLHQYLHLVAALGANPEPLPPRLEVSDDEVQAVAKKFGLAEALAGDLPLLGLNPGAEYGPAKRWPAERFIETVVQVQRRVRGRWLVMGGPAEAPLAEKIAAAIRYEAERPPTFGRLQPDQAALDLAGRTSLRELMALLKACRLVLTNDTGPMHVAAALGTPVVALFGSTAPELTGPGLPGDLRHVLLTADAPCAPCFRRACPIDFRCMNGLGVERVVAAVLEVLNRERG